MSISGAVMAQFQNLYRDRLNAKNSCDPPVLTIQAHRKCPSKSQDHRVPKT